MVEVLWKVSDTIASFLKLTGHQHLKLEIKLHKVWDKTDFGMKITNFDNKKIVLMYIGNAMYGHTMEHFEVLRPLLYNWVNGSRDPIEVIGMICHEHMVFEFGIIKGDGMEEFPCGD